MNESENTAQNRTVVVNTLAVVGFVALIGASMWFAVYSTRYVPTVVNGAGAAAVYLGSIFNRSTASLSVVPSPEASSTVSSTDTNPTTDTTPAVKPATQTETKPVAPTAGEKTSSTVAMNGTAAANPLSGLPDLAVTVNAVGYLTSASTDSFVATSTVPAGSRPAVHFTIKNIGTNMTGAWRFSASIPTQSSYIFESPQQQSLNPGDSIDYTLGFDQAIPGTDKLISITANFDRAVTESNGNNNSASAKVTILGS